MSKLVDCPYCNYENDATDYLIDVGSEDKFDCECSNCEEEFEVYVECVPSMTAYKIEYVDCEKCSRSTRDPKIKGKVFPFPKGIDEQVLCDDCWIKGVVKDVGEEQ